MNKELEELIEKALIYVGNYYKYYTFNLDNSFDKYSPTYTFTTENIKNCFKKLELKNKSLLTVCGSGNQVFNAVLLGARKIDAFDISGFSEMFFNLKKIAIEVLSYEEFFEFFYLKSICSDEEIKKYHKAFNIKTYWKITPYLDERTRIFWDNLYLEENGFNIRKSALFESDIDKKDVLIMMNNYLNPEGFLKLKK